MAAAAPDPGWSGLKTGEERPKGPLDPGWQGLRTPGQAPDAGWAGLKTTPEKEESPLWLKALRLPGKGGDFMNAFLRRYVDEKQAWEKQNPGKVYHPDKTALMNALTVAAKKGGDLNVDVPPTAIRTLLGVKAGESGKVAYGAATILDYLAGFKIDPAGPLIGAASRTKPARAVKGYLGAKAQPVVQKVVQKTIASKPAQALHHALGTGPLRPLMHGELRARYEDPLIKRLDQAGLISRDMHAWQEAQAKNSLGFRAILRAYQGRPGSVPMLNPTGGKPIDPLTDMVGEYVRRAQGKGYNPARPLTLSPADRQFLVSEAGKRFIPFATVEEFGKRLIAHADETIRAGEATGKVYFRRARGLSFKAMVPTSAANPPPALVAAMQADLQRRAAASPTVARAVSGYRGRRPNLMAHLVALYGQHAPTPGSSSKGWTTQGRAAVTAALQGTGIPEAVVAAYARQARKYTQAQLSLVKQGAKQKSEEILRNQFFDRYLRGLLARPVEATTTQLGRTAYTGGGLEAVREAGIRRLFQELRDDGTYIKEVPAGQVGPPGWVKLPHTTKATGFMAKGDKQGKLIATYWAPPHLDAYIRRELAQTQKLTTTEYRALGIPDEATMLRQAKTRNTVGRIIGAFKQGKLALPSGMLKDAFGTAEVAGIVAARVGEAEAAPLNLLPRSLQLALHFKKTGRWSGEAQDLYQLNPRLLSETQSSTATLRAGAQRGTESLLKGRATRFGVIPPAGELVGKAWAAPAAARGVMEQAFKIALFQTIRGRVGDEAAAKLVADNLLDFSDQATLLEGLNRGGWWIFNSWPVGQLKAAAKTIISRPDLVTRGPRLQRLAQQEMLTPPEVPEKLPDYQMGPGTFPTSRTEPTFGNFSAYLPFESLYGTLSGLGMPVTREEHTLPPRRALDRLRPALQGSIYTPILEQFLGEQLYGTPERPFPLEPKGSPAGAGLGARARELGLDLGPAYLRPAERVAKAAQGEAFRPGRWAEDPNLRAEALAAAIGVRPIRAETSNERKERLEASVEKKAVPWEAFMAAAEAASGLADLGVVQGKEAQALYARFAKDPRFRDRNPHARDWAQVTQIPVLLREKEAAMGYLKTRQGDAINDQGKITDLPGLIDGFLKWKAIVDRLEALDR